MRGHAREDVRAGDAVVNEISGGRKRGKRSSCENDGDADANLRFAEALEAGKNDAGWPVSNELEIQRAEKQEKTEEKRFRGDHRAVRSSVNCFERANIGKAQH